MNKIDTNNKIIAQTIFYYPHLVVGALKDSGYLVGANPTLNDITEKVYDVIYNKTDKVFAEKFDTIAVTGEYANFVGIALAVVGSVTSGILGSNQAKKQRRLQQATALAKLEQDRLLSEEQIRSEMETERLRILANTLNSYRQSLQGESTERQKNVYLYLLGIGGAIAIIYGTTLILE